MKNTTVVLFQSVLAVMMIIGISPSHAASQSDLNKEKRWEEQIVDSLLVGEVIKLKKNDTEFLALFTESNMDNVKGAVILLHGRGAHPAWPDVIEPLRMELPEHGWHTLSLQMPVLGNDATDDDYPPLFAEVPTRIQAGVDFLKRKGVKNIVVAGHSLGAAMGTYYLSTLPDRTVKTFVMISSGAGVVGDKRMDSLTNFKHIRDMNIIDVYGSEDNENIFKQLIYRAAVSKNLRNDYYQRLKIKGANHLYQGKQAILVKELNKTLTNL